MRASSESISVLRLYADDVSDSSYSNLDTVQAILNAAGFSGKALKIRLIAVGWSANAATNKGGCTLEFNGNGATYNIAAQSIKPVRTRVPQKDYIDGQWMDIPASGFSASTQVGSIGPVLGNTKLFACDGTVNFVDIGVRY